MSGAVHLVRRFLGSIRPGPPAADDVAWLRSFASVDEVALFDRMSNPDRRHALAVARAVDAELGGADPVVLVAAVFHDVGKVVCGYRTPARVVATLVWTVVPHERAEAWSQRGAPWRRLGEYRRHPELGAELLEAAGAAELAVHWAADHHRPPDEWRVPVDVARVLKACDDD